MCKKNFAIFRCSKLKRGVGTGTLSRSIAHLKNHSSSAEISHPESSKNNKLFFYCNNYISKRNELIKYHNEHSNKALRKDASIAIEMVFSMSSADNIDIKKWIHQTHQFVKEHFPTITPIVFAYHEDEKTPHIHFIGFSTIEDKTISSAKILRNKANLERLQTEYARSVESLGLCRGIPKKITRSNHKTKMQHNRDILLNEKEELKKIKKEIFENER